MALLLFSFLFIIIVRSEHTHSNTILRLSQTVDTALNLTDCHIYHPSSGHHDKNLWASSVLLNKIIGSFSRWHLHLYRQMILNKSTSEFGSALLCLWIQQRSWGDGPITCHLEETNKRSKYVTRLMRAFWPSIVNNSFSPGSPCAPYWTLLHLQPFAVWSCLPLSWYLMHLRNSIPRLTCTQRP